MTQITLRQSHKLVEKLSARLSEVDISTAKKINVWDVQDANAAFTTAASELSANVARRMDIINARADIRDSIRVVNALKVDDLIAQRKRKLDIITTLRSLVLMSERAVSTPAALQAKIVAVREAAKNTAHSSYNDNDHITVSLLSADQTKALEKQIQEAQLEIEKIEDTLTSANADGKISLGEATLAVLKAEGLF